MLSIAKRIKFSNSNTQTSQFIWTGKQKKNHAALFSVFLNKEQRIVSISISDSVFKYNDLIRNVFSGWLIEDTNDDMVSHVAVFYTNIVCRSEMVYNKRFFLF